jgi:hypothetical protein
MEDLPMNEFDRPETPLYPHPDRDQRICRQCASSFDRSSRYRDASFCSDRCEREAISSIEHKGGHLYEVDLAHGDRYRVVWAVDKGDAWQRAENQREREFTSAIPARTSR